MPKEFSRTRRVGEQIRRDLAQLIRDEMSDDRRMVMVSITAVEVTRDLSHARVYVTILGDLDRAKLVGGLNQAAPMLRRELGRKMYIRTVPRLEFIYDEVVEQGARLSALISTAVAADNRRHQDDDLDEEKSS